jgi:hypothetical protein
MDDGWDYLECVFWSDNGGVGYRMVPDQRGHSAMSDIVDIINDWLDGSFGRLIPFDIERRLRFWR